MKCLIILLVLSQTLFAQNLIEIKGLRTYSIKNEILPPIIIYNDFDENGIEDTANDHIVIEFDVKSTLKPQLQIIFQLCDKYWKPIDNLFLQNFGKDRFYNLQFRPAPNGVKTYNYTFKQIFPDERGQITFPFSGKYKYIIADFSDAKKVYGEGFFIVAYQKFQTEVSYSKEVIDDSLSDIMEFNRRHRIKVNVEIPKPFDVFRQNEVEIIQNQKFFFSNIINFNRKSKFEFGRYLSNNVKQYIKRDLLPVNEYRQIDLTDIKKYPNDRLLTSFTGIDVSRKFTYGGKDFNGGLKYYNIDDIYNEYLDYRFDLTLPFSIDGDVYVIGSFNNWKLDQKYKMEKTGNYYSVIVNLKRGIYDYQYVVITETHYSPKSLKINWIEIEGNNWNTKNTYYIIVYYNNPDFGGWDEIVAFAELNTN